MFLSPQMIMLQFTQFKVEPHANCDYDSLAVHDGTSTSAHLIGLFCGDTLPNNGNNINSTSNQLYLVFRSDSSISSDGFQFAWSAATPG